LGICGIEAGVRLKEEFLHRDAVISVGSVCSILSISGERFFVRRGPAAFQFFRIQAGVGPLTEITGMLMFGKMSVRVLKITTARLSESAAPGPYTYRGDSAGL
jgi:hypothetical protein